MELTKQDVLTILKKICDRMIEQADYLSDLDAATGDAEHGINMKKGFSDVLEHLPELASGSIGGALSQAGRKIMTSTGGSAGILYSTAFLAASKACTDKNTLDVQTAGQMLRAALDAMMQRGGAKPGDKTMIDTLHPAVLCFEEHVARGQDWKVCSAACAAAARAGMEHTRDLVARKGRASYQGEGSKGHQDPGATSMYYIFEQADAYIQSK